MKALIFWGPIIGQLALLINVVLCLRQRKNFPAFFQWFIYFLVTGMFIQVFAKVLYYQSLNNLPLLHLYTLLEFIFLSLYYQGLLGELKLKYFSLFIFIGISLILINTLLVQPITSFNSVAKTFTQLSYISYALLYFFSLAEREHRALTLINSAILIYYAGSLFIFMFTNVWMSLNDFTPYSRYLWVVNIFLDIIFQLIILYTLWKTSSQQTKSSP